MVKEYFKRYKEEIKRCIEDLKHKDTIYKQVPNMLTFSRAIGMIPVNILLLTGNVGLGIGLIALLLITDFFDGRIARKWDIQSKFGADLDAVCDKFMFLGLAIPLMIGNPMLIINFVLEGLISYINVFGRMKGLDTKTVFAGKIKTCFLSAALFMGYLVQFFDVSPTLFNILTSMTIGSQVITIDNYMKAYKDMKNVKENEEICGNVDNKDEIDKQVDIELEKDKTLINEESLSRELSVEESFTSIKPIERIEEFDSDMKHINTGKVRVREKNDLN